MDNQQVHQTLISDAHKDATSEIVKASSGIHDLIGKLKAFYEKEFGKIKLDLMDWHWQATALRNHVNNVKEEPPPKPLLVGSDGDSLPPVKATEMDTENAHLHNEPGQLTNEEDPTIKSKPKAGDPSFKRDTPDVTLPQHANPTPTPGSPAADEPHLTPEK